MRWKILFYSIPQFIYESKSERIIEIGPRFIVKIKVARFFMTHGVYIYFPTQTMIAKNDSIGLITA